MTDQITKAKQFRALHVAGKPLILFNVWDAGSAKTVAAANAKAVATGSWAVAAAHGLPDGEKLPLDLAIANLKRIVEATDLPVSIDIESGYGAPVQTIERAIEAGAIGCNLEDSFPHDGTLRPVSDQVANIEAARKMIDASGIPYFINARTDVFFQKGVQGNEASFLQSAIDRAKAYADAGADSIFVPGLVDVELVEKLVAASLLPVNVMLMPGMPDLKSYADVGVARLSYGPMPYSLAMNALGDAARSILGR
jgi:2-methylisocitrate lyase-like PEP mutase family enzyme